MISVSRYLQVLVTATGLTHDTLYRTVLLRAADTLSKLFNPKVGTILFLATARAGC
jgi:hypothetical protein